MNTISIHDNGRLLYSTYWSPEFIYHIKKGRINCWMFEYSAYHIGVF